MRRVLVEGFWSRLWFGVTVGIYLWAVTGCDTTEPRELDPERWRMLAVEGVEQEATVGQELPEALGAQLLQCETAPGCDPGTQSLRVSADGASLVDVPLGFSAVPGELVCFAGAIGAGDPLNSCTITDDEGVARVRWRLGYLANRPSARFWIAAFADREGAIEAIDTLLVRAQPANVHRSVFRNAGGMSTIGRPSPWALEPCWIMDQYGNPVPYTLSVPAFAHWDAASASLVADSIGSTIATVMVADTAYATVNLEVRDGNPGLLLGVSTREDQYDGEVSGQPCPREGY